MKEKTTYETVRHTIGANIKRVRLEQNLSQDKLSKMIGMNRSFLSEVETGTSNISVDKLVKLAEGLGVSITALFEGLEDKPPSSLG